MISENVLKVKIILGSTRPKRFSEHAGRWIFEQAMNIEGIESEILDLRDYEMPFFNEPVSPSSKNEDYTNEAVARWTKKIKEADAFIVVTPEYNYGYSAVLKNALDYVYPEWNNKPIGFVAYGSVGGARALEQLRSVSVELQMAPIRTAVHITAPWGLVDEKGGLKPGALEPYKKTAEGMLSQLIWWAEALKAARTQTLRKYARTETLAV
ncbi:MAG: NAD(P)H-dependent oxidoreductase [bacterium]|nr:NAD(P)H-dependent oxidoreductase [bacterium]